MDTRVFMPGEPQVPNLSLLERLERRVDGAVFGEDPVGIVVVDHFMKLPQVDMVGLEPAQAVFEVGLSLAGGAAANLGHEEDLVAPASLGEGLAHSLLGDAVVVVPGVVHEVDPFIDGPLDQADAVLLVLVPGAVMPAQADHGHHLTCAAERAQGNAAVVFLLGAGRSRQGRRCDGRRTRLHEIAAARTTFSI